MNPDWFKSQRVLQCLGDESRFRVMTELVRRSRCVTELAALVGLSQSCTTRHLQVLDRAGLVSSRRLGKRVVFCVREDPRVVALLAWALPLDAAGDLSRAMVGSAEDDVESSSSQDHGVQPVASDIESPKDEVPKTVDTGGSFPEAGPRSERTRTRELEDFLL